MKTPEVQRPTFNVERRRAELSVRRLCFRSNVIYRLSTDSLVMAEATFPHKACPHPREEQPADLDGERLREIHAFQSAEKNRDGTKKLIIKRKPLHHRLHAGWHDVDRKHLAA